MTTTLSGKIFLNVDMRWSFLKAPPTVQIAQTSLRFGTIGRAIKIKVHKKNVHPDISHMSWQTFTDFIAVSASVRVL